LLPNTKVKWSEALWGAAIASILINLATRIFTWFLGSGMAAFEVIYGSLGAGLALVTWVYVCAVIVLIGAHISAAVAQVTRIDKKVHHPPDTT
jgi:membrane protein